MCMYYNNMQLAGVFVTNSLGYLITGVNYVIRNMIISFIMWINFKTETIQLMYITKFTFWLQFFNTAFIFLLVNGNLSEQPISFGAKDGPYADFNSDWFRTVGNVLIDTMLFNAWFPLLEFVAYWFLFRFIYRCFDRLGNKGMCDFSAYNTSTRTLT